MKPFALVVALALLLAAGPVRALAQTAPFPGITVQGRAAVRRPADIARFSISVGDRQNPSGGLGGADALVAALKKAGVADAAVANPAGNIITAQSFALVVGSLRKPTPSSVRALVAAVQSELPPNAVTIQNVNFALGLDDCSDVEAIATQAALDDARGRAQLVANAAHVQLGAPLNVSEFGGPNGNCPTKPDRAPFAQVPYDAFGGTGSLDVLVQIAVNVTFGIR
jgi:uncharacterized protein YggE